ncbi:MAG TPA: hypothetical protein VIV12_11795 [Streptosporangiaceae bacterium]
MPAITVPKTPLSTGPGYLYYAPLATALPANTVVGSVFTDAWPGAWLPWGVTREGHEFQYSVDTDSIVAAEYFDPLVIVTTGRAAQIAFECMIISATTMKRALNGGTVTTSGAGTTLLTTVTPPAAGAETRQMVGWESNDGTERLVLEQAFNAGTLTIARKKGADNAGIDLEFHAELPSSGFPFQHYFAGAARG